VAISLVLADDHPIVLDGLERLVQLHADLRVVARCRNGREAVEAVRRHRPDVLVLDIRMPDLDGLGVLKELRRQDLSTRVVLLTAALEEEEVLDAIRLGVWGVVLKEMAPEVLIACIRKVHGGEQWIESGALRRAVDRLLRREAGVQELSRILTARELEVLRMAGTGLRNREIADRLAITEGTVKIHLHNIYDKLKLDGRLALTLFARDRGLV
jgi:DNA-binding NarL/FixJ family response regulator